MEKKTVFVRTLQITCVFVLMIYLSSIAKVLYIRDGDFELKGIMRNISRGPPDENVRKCTHEERSLNIEHQCSKYGGFHFVDLLANLTSETIKRQSKAQKYISGLMVDDEHKLVLCFPAKTGSSTFKYLLVWYSEVFKKKGKEDMRLIVHSAKFLERYGGITRLRSYNTSGIYKRLLTYTKIMAVRNPIARVFSAYREKLAHIKPPACQPYQKSLGSKILKLYRKTLTQQEENCGYDVTFKEFMMYFANNTKHLLADQHWSSFSKTCHPCYIKYDKVIKLETGHSDELQFINDNLKPRNTTTNVYLNNNMSSFNEDSLANNNYKQVYTAFGDTNIRDFEIVRDLYKKELDLFGYNGTLKENGMHTSCLSKTIKGDLCC